MGTVAVDDPTDTDSVMKLCEEDRPDNLLLRHPSQPFHPQPSPVLVSFFAICPGCDVFSVTVTLFFFKLQPRRFLLSSCSPFSCCCDSLSVEEKGSGESPRLTNFFAHFFSPSCALVL